MNHNNLNLPTTDLELFHYHYREEPFRIMDKGLQYRCKDMDEDRLKAKYIIEKHRLDLEVFTDASLVQIRMILIREK